jgi:hypothetical protein
MNLKNITKNIKPVAIGIAGGTAGSYVTSLIEKQSFASSLGEYSALPTAIAGVVLAALLPKFEDFGKGMSIVAGVEIAQSLMGKALPSNAAVNYVPSDVPLNGQSEVETR